MKTERQLLNEQLIFAATQQNAADFKIKEHLKQIQNGQSAEFIASLEVFDLNELYFDKINYERALECIEREIKKLNLKAWDDRLENFYDNTKRIKLNRAISFHLDLLLRDEILDYKVLSDGTVSLVPILEKIQNVEIIISKTRFHELIDEKHILFI